MKPFYRVLANCLGAFITNNTVWFAVTFWLYLQTHSVVATGIMAGVYSGTVALSGVFLGSLVDRYKKKRVMMISSAVTLGLYIGAAFIYSLGPKEAFTRPGSLVLWAFVVLCLLGAIAGNLRSIALSTLVTFLVPEQERDKANGLVGSSTGVAFVFASLFSGLIIGYLGMFWMLVFAIGLTVLTLLHLPTVHVGENEVFHSEEHNTQDIDLPGTLRVVRSIPGFVGLLFFNVFNNLLGGVFMALMDAYGLTMVSVQQWGLMWGITSTGFIMGGLVVARTGLGSKPLRVLFLCNIVMWVICILFPLRASIWPVAIGMFAYLILIPVVEAAEQTVFQKVVPPERQGRVFGFAQSMEQAASPVTALFIGPIAQLVFIPFMTTGAGVDLIGDWFGTGKDRGLALVFVMTGVIGLIITLIAMRSGAYRKLAVNYKVEKVAG